MPQRTAKESPASQRANEALDRVTGGEKTPVKKALAFLLEGSHDPNPAQTQPEPSPIQAQPEPGPKVVQSQPRPSPIAPERNYNKRANSLEHSALPSGLFPGASKKIYDALYVRTRGAVVPTRTIQARHRELLAWSGIKDIKTVKTHLVKLRDAGLISWQTLKGEHEGSFYEVFLPEEASPDLAQSQPNASPNLKTDLDPAQNLDWVGLGKTIDVKEHNQPDKTSFKTNTEKTDDELAPLRVLERELTGKNSSWEEVVAILVTELKIAAGRTTVSSVPAFLAEHLRRRLWKKDKRQLDAERGVEVNSGQVAAITVDISKCPDCFGTGMWYPDGFDKGVARCPHSKLSHG